MIVVTTRFAVAEGRESDFEERLRQGVQLLERPPGLIRNEVHRPCALRFEQKLGQFVSEAKRSLSYEVKTWWRSLQDFEDWTQTPAFAQGDLRRALHETFIGAESLDVHEVFLESPRSGQR
ncbi:MAG: antibiotic biosynthesis monooxygenase [Deltaproteobacteria bacterium]